MSDCYLQQLPPAENAVEQCVNALVAMHAAGVRPATYFAVGALTSDGAIPLIAASTGAELLPKPEPHGSAVMVLLLLDAEKAEYFASLLLNQAKLLRERGRS